MMREAVTRRVLGAVSFVDGNTGLPLLAPLQASADTVTLRRNNSGLYVMYAQGPLSRAYRDSFMEQPGEPAVGSLTATITVVDPQNRYLPCRQTISLPRDPDPANAAGETSLFRPVEVALYPAPSAVAQPGWAIVRLSVREAGSDEPIPGAYIRIHAPGDEDELYARGLAEWRGRTAGEAFIGVPNIPVTSWNEGNGHGPPDDDAVVNVSQAVTITVYVDPAFAADSKIPPNPAELESNRDSLPSASSNQQLSSGKLTALTIAVPT